MRALHTVALIALTACTGPTPEGSEADEQLRGLGVNVGGNNVLHDAEPSVEAHTRLTGVPIHKDAFLNGGFVRVVVVGGIQDWTATLTGDGAFGLIADGFGLQGIECVPLAPGVYSDTLTFTSPSQPGREFRVPLRCEASDAVRIVPTFGSIIADDGTIAGSDSSFTGGTAVVLEPGSSTPTPIGVQDPRFLQHGFGDAGFVGVGTEGLFRWDGAVTALPDAGTTIGSAWASEDGEVALYCDGSQLFRVEGSTVEPHGEPELFNVLEWASTDGRFVITNHGNIAGDLRDLTLIDTELGTSAPFVRPDGTPWEQGYAPVGIELSPDLSQILVPTSSFGTTTLTLYERDTADSVDLLTAAVADMAARDAGSPSLSAFDVTPDFTHVAVAFDNITADPGGFRLDASLVYVVEIPSGRTWLVSVDANGVPIDFALGGFDGRLLEHVALSPDASKVLYGRNYVAERSAWVEVLP
ncbi:MAG: hypothetical protein R3F61_14705 [Myxococcota bacterium]